MLSYGPVRCIDPGDIQKISAGTRQRLGLARALLSDPAVLLLDEPFRNLDPHAVMRFRRLLKDHLAHVNGKTVLLSTHQLDEARRVADIVVIMDEGKILKVIEGRELAEQAKDRALEETYLKLFKQKERMPS